MQTIQNIYSSSTIWEYEIFKAQMSLTVLTCLYINNFILLWLSKCHNITNAITFYLACPGTLAYITWQRNWINIIVSKKNFKGCYLCFIQKPSKKAWISATIDTQRSISGKFLHTKCILVIDGLRSSTYQVQ